MSDFKATIHWQRNTPDFDPKTYDRTYTVRFNGGIEIQGSAAPEYMGKADLANPEELFVSALSGCHMLTFLSLAARQGYTIDSYKDEAKGALAKDTQGRMAITKVTLQPKIVFSGNNVPSAEDIAKLHHKAHEFCFIANSVTTAVEII